MVKNCANVELNSPQLVLYFRHESNSLGCAFPFFIWQRKKHEIQPIDHKLSFSLESSIHHFSVFSCFWKLFCFLWKKRILAKWFCKSDFCIIKNVNSSSVNGRLMVELNGGKHLRKIFWSVIKSSDSSWLNDKDGSSREEFNGHEISRVGHPGGCSSSVAAERLVDILLNDSPTHHKMHTFLFVDLRER